MNTIAIGFANKFYTLWNITEETKPLGNGCNYVVTHYTYIKNISFDKETALAKYPNATLDENLRGKTTSWSSQPKEVWTNVNCFRFGKYKYQVIDSTDINYLEWYWDQLPLGDHKDYVSSYLEGLGYEIRSWDNGNQYLMSPEDLENEKENNKIVNSLEEKLNNREIIEFTPEYNPNIDGDIRVGDVIYHFNEIKENWYNGFEYYLPVVNGKQKRIKNKKLAITKYTYSITENVITINIKEFIINK